MPDTRFSWRALLEHLRKFGAIYLIGIAVCLFGTNLLWTMTAPTIPPEQSVIVYLAAGYSNPEPLSGIASEMLTETQKMDNTLRSVEFQSLQYIESEMDYTGPMTLLARLSVGEGDAFLASRQVNASRFPSIAAVIRPPCFSATAAAMASPMPKPPFFSLFREGSTR